MILYFNFVWMLVLVNNIIVKYEYDSSNDYIMKFY